MKKIAIQSFVLGAVISAFSFNGANAQSWDAQGSGFATASRALESIYMPKAGVAWGLGRDGSGSGANVREFTRTVNGGTTWTSGEIKTTTSTSGNRNTGLANIMALNENIAYAASYIAGAGGINGIFKTKDGGTNWVKLNTTEFTKSASFLNVVYFWDEANGCALGDPESGEFEMYTTIDSGKTWTRVLGENIPNPVNAEEYGTIGYYAVSGNSIWYPTTTGRVLYSINRGLTWASAVTPYYDPLASGQNNPVSIPSLTFKDPLNGFGIVLQGTGIPDVVLKTTDGGVSWTELSADTLGGLYKKSDIVYIPGTDDLVMISVFQENFGSAISKDNGVTWTNIDKQVNQYTSVDFFDENNGFAGGFVTTDGTTSGAFKYIKDNTSSVPPVAVNDNYVIQKNITTTFTVLNNDYDADGTLDVATVVATNPSNGSITIDNTDGSIRYVPNTDYIGSDSFTYTVKDNGGNTSNSATVNIVVNPTTSVKNLSIQELSVFPNPSYGVISIKADIKQASILNIYNHVGQLVQSISVPATSAVAQINVSELANGAYVLNLISGSEIFKGSVQINK